MTTIKPHFGNNQNTTPNKEKGIVSSLAQTGIVAGGGAIAGAGVGTIAGFLPTKPTSAKLIEELTKSGDTFAKEFVAAQDAFNQANLYDGIVDNISKNSGKIRKTDLVDVMKSVGMEVSEESSKGGIKGFLDKTLATVEEESKVTDFIKKKREEKCGLDTLEVLKNNAKETSKKILEKLKNIGKDSEIYKKAAKATKSQMKAEKIAKGIKCGVFIALVGSLILSIVQNAKAKKTQQMQTNPQ